jgi:outer membrane receptor protein involved in Fe transport
MAAEFNKVASTRSYDLHFGVAGSDKHSKVAYRVYLGSSSIRDQMFWYVNEIGTFGFTQGRNTRLFAGAEVEYHPIGGLKLAASARAHLDNTLSFYAVSDPKIVANILAEYRLKRWKFGVSGDFVGRREWSGSDYVGGNFALVFFAPATFDLHADVSFKVNNGVELFVNGYNLLNQDIFDYAYYNRNGIGFMLGAKIDF